MPKVPFWVFILIAILYFCAVGIDTMDVDASQYAEISREMMQSGDYLHVYDRGMEYLDKPPFLFWANALSMKVFGVNNFAYKFPSILLALLALYATYRLARLLYNESIGRIAALVLATCQGMFLMTNDVRCDTILMGWVITSIWLIQEWISYHRLRDLLLGCAAISFGMMTKGPIALMVPVFCFASDWVLKGQWKNFFRPAYLLGLIIIAVLLIPMSIGLYQQFDLHPEKSVNGMTGVSGLRFFYWSQSFGRITGESPWKNDVDLSFLLQNMVWSFLPWIFLFLPAIVINIIQLARQRFQLHPYQEWITTGGFLLSYLALGSSAYQLPHYIFVAFPLAAIITAKLLYELIEERKHSGVHKVMQPFLIVLSALLLLVVFVLIFYVFPADLLFIAVWVAGIAAWFFLAFRKTLTGKMLWLPAACMIIINVFITLHIYPSLLKYEVGAVAGKYIHERAISTENIFVYKMEDPLNALHFYAQGVIKGTGGIESADGGSYLLTMESGLNDLKDKGVAFDIVKQGQFFKVSELTPEFLNPKTREKATKIYYLVKLK
ncbi:MAG: glycosyltransferase family 39 protein [Flavipsychrobacter sp.]|jgi:4-amino-4-deoxy-L-arabinose transferase-like glycosyltransferase|nr:glycosyltransferase family 39 protein [Flavipsychrobacter sp.]